MFRAHTEPAVPAAGGTLDAGGEGDWGAMAAIGEVGKPFVGVALAKLDQAGKYITRSLYSHLDFVAAVARSSLWSPDSQPPGGRFIHVRGASEERP